MRKTWNGLREILPRWYVGAEDEEEDESQEDEDDSDDDADDGDEKEVGSKSSDPKVKAARDEAAKSRIRAKKAEDGLASLQKRLDKIEEADLSDKEKAERKAAKSEKSTLTLKEQLHNERVSNAILAQAARMSFTDPADAEALIDMDLVDYDEDNDGRPTPASVEKALKALAKSKPYLTSKGGTGSGDGGGKDAADQDDGEETFDDMVEKYTKQYKDMGYVQVPDTMVVPG